MRLLLAIKCFLKVLFDSSFGDQVRQLTEGESAPSSPQPAPQEVASSPPPGRSEAIALVATLQREARFVDLVTESLDGYSDAQIGAAAREVLSNCGKVLDRVFSLQPVAEVAEGESMQVPAGYDTGRVRITGNASQQPPLSGKVVHAGWVATQCELSSWTGNPEAALVVAPAEVEVG